MSVVARYRAAPGGLRIDECFLDFTGVRDELVGIGRELRAAVLRETGLPTCVGFGPTKTLAKLANHVAKTADRKPGSYPSEPRPGLQLRHVDPGRTGPGLRRTPKSAMSGASADASAPSSARRHHAPCSTWCAATPRAIRKQFSVVLEKTVLELRGTSCLDMSDAPAAKQQILVSRSFGKAVTEPRASSRRSASSRPALPRSCASRTAPPAR